MLGTYEIIYADFPWPYTSFGTAKLPYVPMSESDIANFDWSQFMAKRCVIFSWITGPLLDVQMRCIEQWKRNHNLRYIGVAYKWIKTKQDGTPIGAAGPRPTLVKSLGEDVVALTNVKSGRPFPLLTESQKQWIFAPKQRLHSRKPGVVRTRIVELLGDRPRIELFARDRVSGWDGWGDEYPSDDVT